MHLHKQQKGSDYCHDRNMDLVLCENGEDNLGQKSRMRSRPDQCHGTMWLYRQRWKCTREAAVAEWEKRRTIGWIRFEDVKITGATCVPSDQMIS